MDESLAKRVDNLETTSQEHAGILRSHTEHLSKLDTIIAAFRERLEQSATKEDIKEVHEHIDRSFTRPAIILSIAVVVALWVIAALVAHV